MAGQRWQPFSERRFDVGAATAGQVAERLLNRGEAAWVGHLAERNHPQRARIKGKNTDAVIGFQTFGGENGRLLGHVKLTHANRRRHTGGAIHDQQQGEVAAIRPRRRFHRHWQRRFEGRAFVGTQGKRVATADRHQPAPFTAHKLTHPGHLIK